VCWQGRFFRVKQREEDGRETSDEELRYDDENVVNALSQMKASKSAQRSSAKKVNGHVPK